jgi:hypothetical protein
MKKIHKKHIVQAIIDKYEKDSDQVRFHTNLLQGYEKPGRVVLKGSDSPGYTPDVVMEGPDRVELFEVETGKHYFPDKWRVFSLFSTKVNGNFNIVTHEEQLPQLREFLDMNKIDARILYYT